MSSSKKITVKELYSLVENIARKVQKEQELQLERAYKVKKKKKVVKKDGDEKKAVSKSLQEKLEMDRMGSRHGQAMTFDEWEAGAPADNEEVVYHMAQTHKGERKSERQWAHLYNQYEEAMSEAQF